MTLKKSQHEAFNEFFEKPTRASLKDLIKHNIGETDYLDFKAEWPDLSKVSKHVLALANSGGGALIFGLKESKEGVLESVGLEKFIDKSEVGKSLKKHVPTTVRYDVLEFAFTESEYPSLKGKKFQVLLVDYSQKILPILSLSENNIIKSNVAYIREGTQSREATHDQLNNLINLRVESGYSSSHLTIEKDLDQLQILYGNKWPEYELRDYDYYHFIQEDGEMERIEHNDMWNFWLYVDEMIASKKLSIKAKLGL